MGMRSVWMRWGLAAVLLGLLAVSFGPGAARAAEPAADDAVVYIVKSGDRLADIAARYNTTAAAIMEANGLTDPDVIYSGQRLIIPGAAEAAVTPDSTAEPAATPGSTAEPDAAPGLGVVEAAVRGAAGGASGAADGIPYTVALGDSLAKIARAHNVSVAALSAANPGINPNLLWVGQRLLIPAAAAAVTPEPTAAATAVARPAFHEVQAGETLSQIAQRYETTVAALMGANSLDSADIIYVGMKLKIPKPGEAPVSAYAGQATRFVASISQQRCWLYSGDTLLYQWVCSTGRSGWGTQPGSYRIQSKLPKAFGSTWNIWMPYWLGIYWAGASENGIHGLPWDATSGARTWAGLVGTPITYGCVMLDDYNAKLLYDMAYIGMPVIITR